MRKKLSHSIILIFDILSFLGLWYACNEVQRVLTEITNRVDLIEFGNRDFFMVVVLIVPVGHVLAVIEHYNAELIRAS